MKKLHVEGLAAVLIMAAAVLSGCASTKIIDSWRDEGYTGRPASILVLGVTKERGPRTLLEEEFARQLKGHGVQTFIGTALFPDEGLPSKDAILARAAELKPDAVLVVRFIKKEVGESTTPLRRYSVPAGFATSWDGYMGSPSAMGTYSDVGIRDVSYGFYYATVETTMYDLKSHNPLWSIYTSTKYEDHLLKQIGPLTSTIVRELDKAKLLPR